MKTKTILERLHEALETPVPKNYPYTHLCEYSGEDRDMLLEGLTPMEERVAVLADQILAEDKNFSNKTQKVLRVIEEIVECSRNERRPPEN